MIVAPVNSAHTGISATNALTAASFIASPAHQQIHDPVTEIEPDSRDYVYRNIIRRATCFVMAAETGVAICGTRREEPGSEFS